ncbi:MAG: LPS export ABC transporter permease LptF [Nitrospirae bacterium]|nr:LPS export ABC transporter permease LptF [Nitrospirota bacterium]
MKIIDRYIIKELFPPFLLGILLFTFVLLINRIFKLTELIITKGVSLLDAARLFSYIMPSLLTLTIPMSVLLAALVAFGRLSTDSEVIALKATGFSLPRLVAPVMAFSFAALLLTGYFSLYLGPEKARTFKRDIIFLAKSRAAIGIDEGIFNDSFKDVVIYAQKAPAANEMEGVFISDERSPDESYVIIAKKGVLDVDPATGYAFLDLTQGSIHKKGAKATSYQEITFAHNTLSINLYEKLLGDDDAKRGKREMSLGELKSIAMDMEKAGANHYPILTEYYNRFSIPLACVIFGMVGPPLGLYARRSGKSTGMTVAVAVFAVYYLLMKGGENIAASGYMHPLAAVLIPNVVIGGFGVYLLVKCTHESDFGISSIAGGIVSGLRRLKPRSGRQGGRRG